MKFDRPLDEMNTPEVNRVVIPLFLGGQTAWKTNSVLLRPKAEADAESVRSYIGRAKGKRTQVWGFIDLLNWTWSRASSTSKSTGPVQADAGIDCGCSSVSTDVYASPFDNEVRLELVRLAAEMTSTFPRLDGVLIQARFHSEQSAELSQSVRESFLKAKNTDPIDIVPGKEGRAGTIEHAWLQWRMEQMSLLVAQVVSTFKSGNPKLRVAILADSEYAANPLTEKNSTLEDAVHWAEISKIDEIVLEGRWSRLRSEASFKSVAAKAAHTLPLVVVSAAIAMSENSKDGSEPLDPVGDQTAISPSASSMLLVARTLDDWSRAYTFVEGSGKTMDSVRQLSAEGN